MDPFVYKLLAVAAIVLIVGKRAIVGPQVQFARASVGMVVAGVIFLQMTTEKGDFAATVGAVLTLIGILLAIAMVGVDCIHMVRMNYGKKPD